MKIVLDSSIIHILQQFSKIYEEAWLVGGCVRDMLLGREIHDFDITTSMLQEFIRKALGNSMLTKARVVICIPLKKRKVS